MWYNVVIFVEINVADAYLADEIKIKNKFINKQLNKHNNKYINEEIYKQTKNK